MTPDDREKTGRYTPENIWSSTEGYWKNQQTRANTSAVFLLTALVMTALMAGVLVAGTRISDYLSATPDNGGHTVGGASSQPLEIREGTSGGMSNSEVYAAVKESIYSVSVYRSDGGAPDATVTGTAVGEDGYILTNASLVDGAQSLRVTGAAGESMEASLAAIDPATDAAILKVDARLVPAEFADSFPETGERVTAVGNVSGMAGGLLGGMVSGELRAVTYACGGGYRTGLFAQTDISQLSGAGGMLFDAKARLCGLVPAFCVSDGCDGSAFCVRPQELKNAVSALESGETPRRAWLGAAVAGDFRISSENCPDVTSGLGIVYIDPYCSLYFQGAREGDAIISINGRRCSDAAALAELEQDSEPGDTAAVVFYSRESDSLHSVLARFKEG